MFPVKKSKTIWPS